MANDGGNDGSIYCLIDLHPRVSAMLIERKEKLCQ